MDILLEKNKSLLEKNKSLLEKNKPLLIYGSPGSGKTHLALELLKDTILLRLDSINLKGIKDIKKYIVDRIQKRNITLMFKEHNECRGLLLDDIHIFKKHDKKSFNGIIEFFKNNKFYNNKVIITCDTSFIKNKYIMRSNFKSIKCCYSYNNYYKICLDIVRGKKIELSFDNLDSKIYKSNYNFHKFISDCEENKISIRDNFDGIEECTNKLYNHKYNLVEIFRICSGDEKVILFNMIENINSNFLEIYRFVNDFNNHNIYIKDYELLNIPIFMINNHLKYNKNIIYNRYISKNMVSLKNNSITDTYLLYLIDTYIKHNKYYDILISYDKEILEYHKKIYENIYKIKVSFQ